MNESLRRQAKALSADFIKNEKEYMLGFLEAEQQNPKTKTLGETFQRDTAAGVRMLLSVDRDLTTLYENALLSPAFDTLCQRIRDTLKGGGRIFLSGCGSSGRLCMRIEASFRAAVTQWMERRALWTDLSDRVFAIMTGGDYAIIRAVESFEDYIELGAAQAAEMGVSEKDLLIGVTATGETTSILGTAIEALARGAKVMMVICTDPETLRGKLSRADKVYGHENTDYLYIPCGGMAVTGSTRMQSSTIEQAVLISAFEYVLHNDFTGHPRTKEGFISGFAQMMDAVCADETVRRLVDFVEEEASLYEKGGRVTYFADEYVLDLLTDTTERGPTFTTPPFRPQKRTDLPLSWAFVKNPLFDTRTAWERAFNRMPRCIGWSREKYVSIGVSEADAARVPKIDLDALCEFEIGQMRDEEREAGESLAAWVSLDGGVPDAFWESTKGYKKQTAFTFPETAASLPHTTLCIFEHLSMKMLLNIASTGAMARLGRIHGNYMTYLNMSNKKLVDRSTRIIADLCGISYEEANEELFYSKLLLGDDSDGSPANETLKRLLK